MTASGEFAARRREQQVKWMWAMLEERMFARLRSDPALKAKLPKLEAAVAAGRLSPTSAVEEIAAVLERVMRVLLTGFGPFPGAPFNPSAALAERLARRRRPALAGLTRVAHVFATSYAAVDRDLPTLLARRPDIVLMFGLAARTRASAHRDARPQCSLGAAARCRRPSHGGWRHRRAARRGELRGRAPFRALLHAARSARVPARLSRDAGRYLCNYAYWRALEKTAGSEILVQFVHIPLVRRGPMPRNAARTSRGPRLTISCAPARQY